MGKYTIQYNMFIIILLIIIAGQEVRISLLKESNNINHKAIMSLFDSSSMHHEYIKKDINTTKHITEILYFIGQK